MNLDPATGVCHSPLAPGAAVPLAAGATPTFPVFAEGTGNTPFDPALDRVRVGARDGDGNGNVGGGTTVAVRAQ